MAETSNTSSNKQHARVVVMGQSAAEGAGRTRRRQQVGSDLKKRRVHSLAREDRHDREHHHRTQLQYLRRENRVRLVYIAGLMLLDKLHVVVRCDTVASTMDEQCSAIDAAQV